MIFLYKVDAITCRLNSFGNNLEVTIWTTENRKRDYLIKTVLEKETFQKFFRHWFFYFPFTGKATRLWLCYQVVNVFSSSNSAYKQVIIKPTKYLLWCSHDAPLADLKKRSNSVSLRTSSLTKTHLQVYLTRHKPMSFSLLNRDKHIMNSCYLKPRLSHLQR